MSFPLGKPGILSIPRRRDPCHRHTAPPQLREDESPAHSFCPLSPPGSTELSESPLHLGRVTKLALRLPASSGNLKAFPPMLAWPHAGSRTGISQDSPATLTQAQCVSPGLLRLFVFSGLANAEEEWPGEWPSPGLSRPRPPLHSSSDF